MNAHILLMAPQHNFEEVIQVQVRMARHSRSGSRHENNEVEGTNSIHQVTKRRKLYRQTCCIQYLKA